MIRRSSAVVGLTAVLTLAVAGVASAQSIIRPQPRTSPFQSAFNDIVGSTNWAGYAVQASSQFTSVSGSWVEPAVTCSSSSSSGGGGGRGGGRGGARGSGGSQQFASFWAGIDGYSSGSVEQLGTDSDCNGSTPSCDDGEVVGPDGGCIASPGPYCQPCTGKVAAALPTGEQPAPRQSDPSTTEGPAAAPCSPPKSANPATASTTMKTRISTPMILSTFIT